MKENEIKEVINYCYDDKFLIEDLARRKLYLNCGIDDEVIDSIGYHILRYNVEDKGKDIADRQPILVYINSPGGSVTAGFGLIDIIMSSKTPVFTINQATCYSMGFLIFLAGHKRYSMKNSTYLFHDGSSLAWDSMNKLKDRVEFETGQMEEHVKDYVLNRTSIGEKLYNEKQRVEWYMYPIEAKELGIVTDIVGEDCDIDEII